MKDWMPQWAATGATALLCLLPMGAIADDVVITSDQMKDHWPFTVKSGTLGCERGQYIKFMAGGKTYAINGSAAAYSKKMGFGWLAAREIWKDDPSNPGAKVNIAPVIDKGLKLCRPWP